MFAALLSKRDDVSIKFNRSICASNTYFKMESPDGSYIEVKLSLESLEFDWYNYKTGQEGCSVLGDTIDPSDLSLLFLKMTEIFDEEILELC